jgi:hypothetical protein
MEVTRCGGKAAFQKRHNATWLLPNDLQRKTSATFAFCGVSRKVHLSLCLCGLWRCGGEKPGSPEKERIRRACLGLRLPRPAPGLYFRFVVSSSWSTEETPHPGRHAGDGPAPGRGLSGDAGRSQPGRRSLILVVGRPRDSGSSWFVTRAMPSERGCRARKGSKTPRFLLSDPIQRF